MSEKILTPGQEAEKIKTAEKLKFEELFADTKQRSLEGNYAMAETFEDERAVHRESMIGAYWESGVPEKMAMFKLREAQIALGGLAVNIDTLANWDERQQDKGYVERAKAFVKRWKKGWEDGAKRYVQKLDSVLSALGLSVPQTAEEARILKKNIVSFENWQKMTKKFMDELMEENDNEEN